MADRVGLIPRDAENAPFNRAMGLPVVSDSIILGSAVKYVDIFDLSSYGDRCFIGLMIDNPSSTLQIQVAVGDDFSTTKVITCGANKLIALDELSFGYGFADQDGARSKKFRAKLSGASGTLATGSIDYSGGGTPIQPTDGMTVTINGTVYEFSSDTSAKPGRTIVTIGANADASWTNFKNKVNLTEQAVTLTIDTATDVVTITSNYGGASAIAYADGGDSGTVTGATFAGATTSGGSGGVTPIITIW